MNRDILSCSNVTNRDVFFPLLGIALNETYEEQTSPTYHAASKAEYQPLTVELTADVIVTILFKKWSTAVTSNFQLLSYFCIPCVLACLRLTWTASSKHSSNKT